MLSWSTWQCDSILCSVSWSSAIPCIFLSWTARAPSACFEQFFVIGDPLRVRSARRFVVFLPTINVVMWHTLHHTLQLAQQQAHRSSERFFTGIKKTLQWHELEATLCVVDPIEEVFPKIRFNRCLLCHHFQKLRRRRKQRNSNSQDFLLPQASRYGRRTSKVRYTLVQAIHRNCVDQWHWFRAIYGRPEDFWIYSGTLYSRFRETRFQDCECSSKSTHGGAKAQKDNRFPQERQIAFMIHYYSKVSEASLDFTDSMKVILKGDTVQGFDTKWHETLFSLKSTRWGNLGKYVQAAAQEFWRLEIMMALYTQDTVHKHMVRRHMDQTNQRQTLPCKKWWQTFCRSCS